jgi:hypothetical protein
MRLWNTLHQLYRDKLVGLRSARNKRVRRAERPRTRLEVEALDQRLLPSTVPNLGGLTMHFGYPYTNNLAITSVQDQGGGKGTFVAVYTDSRDGVVTAVSGTIALKGLATDPVQGGTKYDFGVTFSGSTTHHQFNPRTGIWSETVERASGSGDFYVTGNYVNSSNYNPWNPNNFVWFDYSGNESDSYSYYSSDGDDIQSESGHVVASDYWNIG